MQRIQIGPVCLPSERHPRRCLRPRVAVQHVTALHRRVLRQCHAGFELLDHRDRAGVDAAQDRAVDRHEVAQQHEREDPRQRRLPLALEHEGLPGRWRDELARQRDAAPLARVQVGVVEEHGGERAERRRAVPAHDLVVVRLGELVGVRGHLGVLVVLGLPAIRDGDGRAGADDGGDGAVQRSRHRLGLGVLGPAGAPALDQLLHLGRGDVDLAAQLRPHAAQRGDLERGDGHVGHGRPRLEAAGQRDDRHLVGAGRLGQLAAGGDHEAPRAQRAGGLVAGQGLLGVARVRGEQDRDLGRRPRRQAVAAGDDDPARGLVAQRRAGQRAADRRPAHAGDDEAPGGVDRLEHRRLHAPERVAELGGEVEDVRDQVRRVDRGDGIDGERIGHVPGYNTIPRANDSSPRRCRRGQAARCSAWK